MPEDWLFADFESACEEKLITLKVILLVGAGISLRGYISSRICGRFYARQDVLPRLHLTWLLKRARRDGGGVEG